MLLFRKRSLLYQGWSILKDNRVAQKTMKSDPFLRSAFIENKDFVEVTVTKRNALEDTYFDKKQKKISLGKRNIVNVDIIN
jgi:hypothetical protein